MFDLDLWPLRVICMESKYFIPFESPYMTSYLTPMNTISLSLTVLEIFDFKVSRVRPWPLTSKGHMGWKMFILFNIPYMTSYLTSIDIISLSRTVFEIFDSKVSMVWPWPLTSQIHLGSNKNLPSERPYMTSYLTSMNTISLSRIVFDIKVLRTRPWPSTPKGQLGSKKYTIRKPIYDILFDFYEHHLSISYRSRDNAGHIFESRTKWRILTF